MIDETNFRYEWHTVILEDKRKRMGFYKVGFFPFFSSVLVKKNYSFLVLVSFGIVLLQIFFLSFFLL